MKLLALVNTSSKLSSFERMMSILKASRLEKTLRIVWKCHEMPYFWSHQP